MKKKMQYFSFLFITICVLFPSKLTSQVESKNGIYVPAKGTVHVLIVFAELVGPCSDLVTSANWPSGSAAPPNADLYFDYVVSANPLTAISRYYKDISLGELNVIGDYYDGTVQVPCSLVSSLGGNYYKAAISQLNTDWLPAGDGNYYTKNGLNLNDFDDYQTLPNGILKNSGNSDGNIDCTIILWRNNPSVGCGAGLGVGNFLTAPLKGKNVYLYGSWDYCPDKLNTTAGIQGYDDFFTIEFMHAIFGDNNFHVGGGAASGTYMFDNSFVFSTNQGFTSNIACGWDRNFLDWKGSRLYSISAQNLSGTETPSDISINSTPNTTYYVLRDFVTIGDAVRIRLPHFNNDVSSGNLSGYDLLDKKNQYLWVENHQLINEFDKNKGKSECSTWSPGLYFYIQTGKDLTNGPNVYGGTNASPNQLNDWFFPLPAEGRWDYYYDFAERNQNGQVCQWGNRSVPYSNYFPDGSTKPNPFTGYSDLWGHIDTDGDLAGGADLPNSPRDGYINPTDKAGDHWQPWFQKWTSIPTGSGSSIPANIPMWGDEFDAFTGNGQKISIGTNPSSAPVLTMIEGGTIPQTYDNRSIHLNNLSVEILDDDFYGGGSGNQAYLIKVSWDDKAIPNDVRWCGNIILKNETVDPLARNMEIDLFPNKIITVDKGLSPVKLNENTLGSGDFSDPSFLHLLNGTITTLQSGSQIKVINGSTFHVQAGANLIIGHNASVNIDATSFICIEEGANVIFQDPNTSKIIVNGIPYLKDYDLQNIVLSSLSTNYYALNSITTTGTSTPVTMPASGDVILQAKKEVTLYPNTSIVVQPGQSFTAKIDDPYFCLPTYDLKMVDANSGNSGENSMSVIEDQYISQSPEAEPIKIKPSENFSFTVFPNPNNGNFTIRLKNLEQNSITGTITVYNFMGTIILQQRLINESTVIDLKDKGKSIYYVKVENEFGIKTEKVIYQ
ncbi:hypothetical protein BH10BAC1_BH10BAC1_04140 [soil metagenome]